MKFRERVGGHNVTDCLSISDADWAAAGVTRHDKPDYDPDTHKQSWNAATTSWDTTALSDEEKDALLAQEKITAKNRATAKLRSEMEKGITVAAVDGILIRADDVGQGQVTRLKDKLASGGTQRLVTRAGAKLTATQAVANLLFTTLEAYVAETVDAEFDAHDAIDALTTPAAARSYTHTWPTRAR
jgi:hypothetical protein